MNLKKIVITIFIVVSLNLSFQTTPLFSQNKNLIVMLQERREDDLTNDFVKENEKKRFEKMVAIKLALILVDGSHFYYNTS